MRVALGRLDGVESVTISLEEGVAVINLADENEVSLASVRQVVRDNGFTPVQTELSGVFETAALPDGAVGIKIGEEVYGLSFPRSTGAEADDRELPVGAPVRASGELPRPEPARPPRFEVKVLVLLEAE